MLTEITACSSCGAKNRVASASAGTPHCAKCDAVLPWLVTATDANFDEVVVDSALPVLLDLWAPWCAPCRVIGPAVAASAARFAGRIKVAKLDVDEAPQTAERFGVRGIPTLLMLRDGQEVERQVGVLVGDALPRWIERTIAKVEAR